ncbi:SGNH/GDSL hydrolase family protein [Pontiellaceae bacterium B12227]|nr:SGNH/GDSL hydrolase family protein [Pontiellaceae bacterium B12227]
MMKKTYALLLSLLFSIGCTVSQAKERWLFLGDSITQSGRYTDYIETWMLLNEADCPEIINLGLSSETLSGLSEPDHPFPRPYLLNRLDRVLERTKPDVVIACYGMNCAIYHPFSSERFKAYQSGINKLVADAQAIGASVILLTPPPFAGRVKPKAPPGEGENFGFKRPATDYNEVLAKYGDWILSLDGENGVRAFTIRPAIEKFMEKCYPREPVHPNHYGHELMAEAFLQSLEKETGSNLLETGISPHTNDAHWNTLIKLVNRQRMTYDRALLNDIGHGNRNVMKKKTLPLPEAEEKAKAIDAEIHRVLTVGSQE